MIMTQYGRKADIVHGTPSGHELSKRISILAVPLWRNACVMEKTPNWPLQQGIRMANSICVDRRATLQT